MGQQLCSLNAAHLSCRKLRLGIGGFGVSYLERLLTLRSEEKVLSTLPQAITNSWSRLQWLRVASRTSATLNNFISSVCTCDTPLFLCLCMEQVEGPAGVSWKKSQLSFFSPKEEFRVFCNFSWCRQQKLFLHLQMLFCSIPSKTVTSQEPRFKKRTFFQKSLFWRFWVSKRVGKAFFDIFVEACKNWNQLPSWWCVQKNDCLRKNTNLDFQEECKHFFDKEFFDSFLQTRNFNFLQMTWLFCVTSAEIQIETPKMQIEVDHRQHKLYSTREAKISSLWLKHRNFLL